MCLTESGKQIEKFKAWIATDLTSKTKAMYVVCNSKVIDIARMGEATL